MAPTPQVRSARPGPPPYPFPEFSPSIPPENSTGGPRAGTSWSNCCPSPGAQGSCVRAQLLRHLSGCPSPCREQRVLTEAGTAPPVHS